MMKGADSFQFCLQKEKIVGGGVNLLIESGGIKNTLVFFISATALVKME